MSDREFLIWLHERIVHVLGESKFHDYMHKLRCIIADTPPDRITPNDGRGGNCIEDVLDGAKP